MEKLSKRALGCMYTAAILGAVIGIGVLIAIIGLYELFCPKRTEE